MATQLNVRSVLLTAFAEAGYQWSIKGLVDAERRLYTLSNDTKLISKVFELIAFPVIFAALEPHGVQIETEERQTVYPDLTVILNQQKPNKIAIDVKSTYRKNNERAGFTLGSYTAYMRPPFTKNIRYRYDEYLAHWIVGFIYSRVPNSRAEVRAIDDLATVVPPINDVELIIQEKWRIASDRPGSGNTTNIGSVRQVEALRAGMGTFAHLGADGKQVFEDYWKNFDRAPPRKYANLNQYCNWRRNN